VSAGRYTLPLYDDGEHEKSVVSNDQEAESLPVAQAHLLQQVTCLVVTLPLAAAIASKPPDAPRDVLHDITHERVDYWVAEFSKDHDYHKKIAAGLVRMPQYQKMIE